jgi:thiosulfate/3-mercaptopyruvate sulfurtransferase
MSLIQIQFNFNLKEIMKTFNKKYVAVASVVVISFTSFLALPSAQAAPKNQARSVVQADWLEKNLDDPKVVVIEVSTEPGVYERGHIRNAVKITWHTDLVDTVNRDVVSAANFQKFAQAAGINQDSTVVLYGDKNNWFAAWGAWIFNLYGAKDVRLLDGGRVKWEKDGRALTTAVTTKAKGNFTSTRLDKTLRATLLQDIIPVAKKRVKVDLIDIRSADEYSGKILLQLDSRN